MSLSLGLALGGAACSEGCARELPVETRVAGPMTLDDLRALLLPKGEAHYKLLAEPELEALERLVTVLYARASAGRLSSGQARRVARDAALAGVELHDIELAHEGITEQLWVVVEPPEDRRGRGVYVFRLGKLRGPKGRAPRVEHVLEAPHARFDEHTGEVALGLFIEREPGSFDGAGGGQAAPARALVLSSVHRYEQLDGTRGRRRPASKNPADAAHRGDHPLARATAQLAGDHRVAVIQLHGFERNEREREPDVIVSAGVASPRAASRGVAERLSVALAGFEVRQFGVGIDRLGATSNVQGRAARNADRCFVHVETSGRVRARLREDRALRRRVAAALFGAPAQELRGGCQ